MMPANQYWWNHLTNSQRDFINAWFIENTPNILLKDVVQTAFVRDQNVGWHRESGWPQSEMRII